VKIGANELCWCGSSKRYKQCHKLKDVGKILPPEALTSNARRFFKARHCLHPRASKLICGNIGIQSHTLSRKSVLSELINPRSMVFTFFKSNRSSGHITPREVGWREASTFAGFCDIHDKELFAPLDDKKFSNTPEECFLIAYRAICHEFYQKKAAVKATQDMFEKVGIGRSRSNAGRIERNISYLMEGSQVGFEDVREIKVIADQAIITGNYEGWSKTVIHFDGELSIGSVGTPTPQFDLTGSALQVLHEVSSKASRLCLGTVATSTGGALVFVWRQSDSIMEKFVKSLLDRRLEDLPSFCVEVIFNYLENTFFSEKWWVSLVEKQKSYVAQLATNSNPYYFEIPNRVPLNIPWKITEIQHNKPLKN
jgi:hypothetical protein